MRIASAKRRQKASKISDFMRSWQASIKPASPNFEASIFGLDEQKAFGSGMRIVIASNTDLAKSIIEGVEGRYITPDGRFTTDIYGLGAMKMLKRAMPEHVDLPVEIAVARYRARLLTR